MKARFIVNYDFVFLGLLMSSASKEEETISKKKCLVCPKGRNCIESSVFDLAAEVSVMLTYLKLCDDVQDNGFWRGLLKGRIPRLLIRKAYRKAQKALPEYAERANRLFSELSALEKEKVKSLDEPADKFAKMLACIPFGKDDSKRVFEEISYHIGRFIYIIDALDDFSKDYENREYNPIAYRFEEFSGKLPDDIKERVLLTLEDSRQAVLRAFELLDKTETENLLRNIIELGMNASIKKILDKEKENERSV